MKVAIFWLGAIGGESAAAALTAFLATRRMYSVEKQFCAGGAGQSAGWSVWVTYEDGAEPAARTGGAAPRSQPDYRVLLDPETFRIFSGLRTWRKEAAEAAGTEIYVVASNEQLAEVATRRLDTLEGLRTVSGLGAGKLEKYGASLIAAMRRLVPEGAGAKTVGGGVLPVSSLLDEAGNQRGPGA